MARRRPLTILIPGDETVRSDGPRTVAHPSVVAVDSTGAPRFFGGEAVLANARRHSDLSLYAPFTSRVDDHPLTLAYMRWLLRPAALGAPKAPIVLAVPNSPTSCQTAWRAIADGLPGRVVIVPRAIALASGLGLHIDGSAASMVVDLRTDGAEVSILAQCGVLAARATGETSAEAVARVIRSLLEDGDPDVEDDISQRGVHLVQSSLDAVWSNRLAGLLGSAVVPATRPPALLIDGININRYVIDRYVDACRPPSPIGRVMARLRPTVFG
jgi:actin-like ATPase involved in cell morphogenesis